MKYQKESWIAFIGVIAVHAGAIGLTVWSPAPKIHDLELPTVQGILLPAPPAETVQLPSARETPPPVEPPPPEPPKPKPKPKPKPTPTPKPKPKPIPPVEVPPSERAISQEQEAVEETAPPPPPPAPSTPAAQENDTMGAPVTPPREDAHSLSNPKPAYPSHARRLRQTGTVVLEVLILANGQVGEIKLKKSSGFKLLDDTALRAVKRWRYVPAKRGDEAIDYWYEQPIEFTLN